MKKIKLFPSKDNHNGWKNLLKKREPKPPLKSNVKADWIVVGAGFAGLAAARQLAENRPEERIILVEACEVGDGASGRNSGFGIGLPHSVGSSLEELENSQKNMTLARSGIKSLSYQVEKYNIECNWSKTGKYHTAVSERGTREILEPLADELKMLKEPFRWVNKTDLAKEIGSPYFTAAVYTPGCVLFNPVSLVQGLADNLPSNVILYENTPITSIDNGTTIKLQTPHGEISASNIILAVNGLAPEFGFFKNRLLSFAAHASLSRQLTDKEMALMGSIKEWGLTPANAFAGITVRLTQDRRILIRQNIHFCPSLRQSTHDRENNKRKHKELFDERFPFLPEVSMEYTWVGFVCLTQNGAPGFGQIDKNVYSAVCQNAVGVAKGTYSGMLIADLACGKVNPFISDVQEMGRPNLVPPRPFLDLGVKAKIAWEMLKAKHEC